MRIRVMAKRLGHISKESIKWLVEDGTIEHPMFDAQVFAFVALKEIQKINKAVNNF